MIGIRPIVTHAVLITLNWKNVTIKGNFNTTPPPSNYIFKRVGMSEGADAITGSEEDEDESSSSPAMGTSAPFTSSGSSWRRKSSFSAVKSAMVDFCSSILLFAFWSSVEVWHKAEKIPWNSALRAVITSSVGAALQQVEGHWLRWIALALPVADSMWSRQM